eukprot:TRINITY_DN766_c0_g1_i1.p1 TRINITY_DN766_c0_g1~~TRINITY_DN766_c0_g1_i1.p1  ORF type:complete len:257 (-),score=28.40 TRINITY_DN766_c0_g1_i1:24-752(-)
MQLQLFLLGSFIALISAQYTCDVSTDGLLTAALTNPKTASFSGTYATGPDATFVLQTTSNFIISMSMLGDKSVLYIDERDFGTNGKKSGLPPSVLDYSRSNEESGLTTISFSPPISSFVVKMNYDPQWLNVSTPTIIVYSENNTRLACYDIEALAPIRTPGATDGFNYIGVTTNANIIGSIYLSGASMAYWDVTFDTMTSNNVPIRSFSDSPNAPGTKTPSNASQAIAAISMPILYLFLCLF